MKWYSVNELLPKREYQTIIDGYSVNVLICYEIDGDTEFTVGYLDYKRGWRDLRNEDELLRNVMYWAYIEDPTEAKPVSEVRIDGE